MIRITPVYATETLGLSAENIAGAFVVIQLVAFVGALGFGWLAGVIGTKGAILVSIAGWILVAIAAFLLPETPAWPPRHCLISPNSI